MPLPDAVKNAGHRLIDQQGLKLIEAFEGLILYPYDDADGKNPPKKIVAGDKLRGTLTIGYGHTGKDVIPGQTITEAEADQLLEEDLAWAEDQVARLVTVPLTNNQFAALVSFTFNAGEGALASSTLLRRLNAGVYGAVPEQLPRWDKTTISGKKVQSAGLARRRAAEAQLWATPDRMPAAIPPPAIAPSVTPAPVADKPTLPATATGKGIATAATGFLGTLLVGLGAFGSDLGAELPPFAALLPWILGGLVLLTFLGLGYAAWGRRRLLAEEGH